MYAYIQQQLVGKDAMHFKENKEGAYFRFWRQKREGRHNFIKNMSWKKTAMDFAKWMSKTIGCLNSVYITIGN